MPFDLKKEYKEFYLPLLPKLYEIVYAKAGIRDIRMGCVRGRKGIIAKLLSLLKQSSSNKHILMD